MPLSRQGSRFRGGFHDPFDIFREVFGGGGAAEFSKHFLAAAAAGRSEDRQRGSDLRYDMQITLEEAAFGVEKEIEVRKLDTCDKVPWHRRGAGLAHDQLSDLRRPRAGH